MVQVNDNPSQRKDDTAPQETRAAKKSLGQALADFVFGYDFFISYAWSDGRAFAESLEQQLKQRGYDCFLDSTEYASGDNWDLVGQRALRKTANLILVGTPGALRSEPVEREVRRFTRRNHRVIPISFDDSLRSSLPREGLLALLAPEVLSISAKASELVDGPSSATVDRLCGTYRIVRQSTKRQRVVTGVALLLAILAAFALWQWRSAVLRRREAEANLRLAQDQRTVALQAIRDSLFEVQTKLAQARMTRLLAAISGWHSRRWAMYRCR